MQKLIVRNFGPIRELDLDIKDLSLFIGEQATGKSTVAKLVYFFKKVVKDELIGYLYSIKEKEVDLDKHGDSRQVIIRLAYQSDIAHNFFNLFDGINPYFQLDYNYKEDTWLHLDKSRREVGYLKIRFSQVKHKEGEKDEGHLNVEDELYNICNALIEFRKKYLGDSGKFREYERDEKRFKIIIKINDFFGEDADTETIFIPAGRNMLTALSERLPNKGWDMLMERFRDKIADLKPIFSQSLEEIVEQKKLRGNGIPKKEALELAFDKIREILKGEYRVDKDGEKLYFDEKRFVKISLASSGQQEVVWILLQLFILILNHEKVFLIIEEPEAHLFPKAQKSLVELISLLFNENKSQVIITTHSPYILTSFNNLIYAENVGIQHEEVSKIIPKPLWLDVEKVGAYRLANGIAEDLMDEESKMIRAEEIDTVSQSINQDFDALLNLELQ